MAECGCGFRVKTDKRGKPLKERHNAGSHHKSRITGHTTVENEDGTTRTVPVLTKRTKPHLALLDLLRGRKTNIGDPYTTAAR